jgi:hypothetical protein
MCATGHEMNMHTKSQYFKLYMDFLNDLHKI